MQDCMQMLTDEQLCACCGHSTQAMEELVLRYQKLVRSCARPYFLAGADSEDLLQEGMLGLLRAVAAFDPQRETSFRTFAAVCVRSRMISLIRAAGTKGRRPTEEFVHTFSLDSLPDEPGLPAAQQSPEDALIGQEEFDEFRSRLLALLSPLEQRTMELYLQGLSYREIADLLQKSTKSVDNAVQRIRQKLARHTISATTA